ncbi:MAG: hypothetical protein FJ098_02630 [Deltaproteobacteria bacterium]|nr:hypothetical protein [Deltaproteobacteria bacterium]
MRYLPAVLLLFLGACTPMIGDECTYNRDCPTGTYCDKTLPGGYCTLSPCYPGECPEYSTCIEFPEQEKAFCMATCQDDRDCREAYKCITILSFDKTRRFCGVPSD